jgi:serine/threonine-protein kinase
MPLNGGRTFAGYRIVRLLGSGGMGEVYLADHPRLPRRNALKVLPADISGDPEYRARFNREADLASKLWHPHIVSVHDRGEHDDQLWISMDFVDGLDAARLLASRYPAGMPVDLVVRIVTAMASALDYAHKQGLLHRDIKPANIMLSAHDDREQRILLTDFGIARNAGDISGLTATNMTVGTVAYSAPEQLVGDHIDGRADQYALAASAYYLLTASQLFPHSNPAAVISRHLSVEPPSLSASKPGLVAMDAVLTRALAKDPEARFSCCNDFAEALARAAVGRAESHFGPTAAATVQPTLSTESEADATATVGAFRPWSRFKAASVIPSVIAGALVLIAALLIVLVVRRDHSAADQHAAGETSRPASSPTSGTSTTSSAAAPPPAPAAATSNALIGRYAIPACYSIEDLPTERPTAVTFEYCADGGAQLDHMTWTAWNSGGADGQGYFSIKTCHPSCAEGGMAHYPTQIHAANPAPLQANSGCPIDMQFYTDLTLAFPTSVPNGVNGETINTQYNGFPAIRFTTQSNRSDAIQLVAPGCW